MDFKKIEEKWQKKWEEAGIFKVKEDPKKKKFYCLEMFAYPSGEGLHMGHAFNYIIGDIYARFKRMCGFNVLHPVGYDSLGLPAENAAIKAGVHPKEYTEKAIKNFIKQQKSLGLSYDWSRLIMSHDSLYYKWDQWIFLKMFERGLAFRKRAAVNWCPKCKTVLANEQVHNGKCWRHEDTNVEIKHLEQWFFKITDYADELYEAINKLEGWPEDVKAMQKNWIGKSHGIEINFKINGKDWPIFTTRPDTIYGVTFMVVSAQHPKLMELVTKEQEKEVENFLKKVKSTSEKDIEELEKEGAFTGSYAVNPVTKEKVPVYTGNFVIAEYGSGMVMAVPAHDQRDFLFAKKYNIPIKIVIQNKEKSLDVKKMERAYTEDGILVNSDRFNEIGSKDAIEKISDYIEKQGLGKKVTQYRLRDWLISRQRYWGTPIPIIYCDKCGIVPVAEKDLPIVLPEKVAFGKGNPLETNKEFVNTKCPKCKGKARRETDTMDTFVNSSWYFLRYCDPKNNKEIFDREKVKYWMPIDQYIGGKEHACMHLIYFRFYTKFLRDLGLLNFDEPAINLFNQGMIHGEDGYVMSKSRGNIVLPQEVSVKYGSDTARFFLMLMASPDKGIAWNKEGIEGSSRFIKKFFDISTSKHKSFYKSKDKHVISKINIIIKDVTKAIENLEYNKALMEIIEFVNYLKKYSEYISPAVWNEAIEKTCLLLAPFVPHLCEEVWQKLGNKGFVSVAKWPEYNPKAIDLRLEFEERVVEQTTGDIKEILKLVKIRPRKIIIFVSPAWKYDVYNLVLEGKELKQIMQQASFKKIGKEVAAYVQKLQKKKPLEEIFLTASSEHKAFEEAKESLEKEFNCKVEITSAEKAVHAKAKSAEPAKPGILIE